MKIREVYDSRICKFLNVGGIVLWPFVFYYDKNPDLEVRYHEMTHLLQIKRHGVIGFYWLYLVNYVILRFSGKSHALAYYELDFEKEAFDDQYWFRRQHSDEQAAIFYGRCVAIENNIV